MENKEKASKKFSQFLNKATDLGKKAADGIQQGAKELSDQTQKTLWEQRMKKYNPLFRETYFSEEFKLPNIIQIVDASVRKDIDVCEGAIGWTKKTGDVEVLYLYDEFACESGVNFVPFNKCDSVYCVDVFDKTKYIISDSIFESSMSEKMAELEHIAFSLGAKSYSVEMIEEDSNTTKNSNSFALGIRSNSASTENSSYNQSKTYKGGRSISYFEGSRDPVRPKLKWFKNEENIKNLIEMRCTGDSSIKSKVLVFKGSSSATMSRKNAAAIDIISKVKGEATMEKKAIVEHSTQMVFEIEF